MTEYYEELKPRYGIFTWCPHCKKNDYFEMRAKFALNCLRCFRPLRTQLIVNLPKKAL